MSNNRITASAETLMTQASMTARSYFLAAIKMIDDEFGAGYAQEHPQLIAALVQAAGADYNTASAVQAFQDGIEAVTVAIRH